MTTCTAPIFNPLEVTVPANHARVGDTLIYSRHGKPTIEAPITGIVPVDPRGNDGREGIRFELEGSPDLNRHSWSLGEYVSIRRAQLPVAQGELKRVVCDTVKAYSYRDALILCTPGSWRVRLRDGRGRGLFGSGYHMRTEDQWRREAMRVIDALLNGEMSAATDEQRLLEARFLTGDKLAAVTPKQVPVEVSQRLFIYREHLIEAERFDEPFPYSANVTITRPDGTTKCVRMDGNHGSLAPDIQAAFAAGHIDSVLDS